MRLEQHNTTPPLGALKAPVARRLPGDGGVWEFIMADTWTFGLFFLAFTFGRTAQPALYGERSRCSNPSGRHGGPVDRRQEGPFMELRHAPWPWRLAFEAWAVVSVAAILTGHWLGGG
jgi:heme/copper-type cytochrome/quinol oxidase subunit 3